MLQSKWLFLRSSPRGRKLAAVVVLGLGVVLIGRVLEPVAPREVELRVRMTRYRLPPEVARSLSVEFTRDAEAVRIVQARFDGPVPVQWHQTINLPAGPYRALVRVELDRRSVVRSYPVQVRPGETVELAAPAE